MLKRYVFPSLGCLAIGLVTTFMAAKTFAASTEYNSGDRQVQLIELYTSEGCSSCPPADRWLSSINKSTSPYHAELWNSLIPVAFHVDYWDYLGWKDVFSSSEFSTRQRLHQHQGNINSVYTPGFVVSGKEWRTWFGKRQLPKQPQKFPGNLSLKIEGDRYTVEFDGNSELVNQTLTLHLAKLGMGLQTKVSRGENAGRKLKHDFVVLSMHSQRSDSKRWRGKLSTLQDINRKANTIPRQQTAYAAWITVADSLSPIQVVGGLYEQ